MHRRSPIFAADVATVRFPSQRGWCNDEDGARMVTTTEGVLPLLAEIAFAIRRRCRLKAVDVKFVQRMKA